MLPPSFYLILYNLSVFLLQNPNFLFWKEVVKFASRVYFFQKIESVFCVKIRAVRVPIVGRVHGFQKRRRLKMLLKKRAGGWFVRIGGGLQDSEPPVLTKEYG